MLPLWNGPSAAHRRLKTLKPSRWCTAAGLYGTPNILTWQTRDTMQKTIALNSIKSGQNARVAMAAVLGSESIFFITLISAYFYLRSDMSAWPMAGASLMRLVFPAANTTLLLVSALSFYLG